MEIVKPCVAAGRGQNRVLLYHLDLRGRLGHRLGIVLRVRVRDRGGLTARRVGTS